MDGYEYTKGHLVCEQFDPNASTKKTKSKKKKTSSVPVQQVDYKSNNFTVTEVTTDTKCTLTFTKSKVVKYKIRITNSEDYKDIFTISKGTDEIEVESGKTGEIKITPTGEDVPKLSCNVMPSQPALLKGEYTFTWLNVTKNISCELKKG